jgi:hypothetical protein
VQTARQNAGSVKHVPTSWLRAASATSWLGLVLPGSFALTETK